MIGDLRLMQGNLATQLETPWRLLELHLTGLDDDELLWRPASVGLHVHESPTGWTADWPDREDYDVGPPSIAWLTWHIGFWWSMVFDHSFGDASSTPDDVRWPGSADGVRAWLSTCHDQWVAAVSALRAEEFGSPERTRWPMTGRPFADVVAWVNVELMKNAAEIGYARFLHAARHPQP